MLRTALLAFALSPAVAAAADGAATKAAAPDLSALIECRLGHADFMAYMPVLQDPLKAVALGWRPLPQSNPFMVEYRLNAPVTVFGRSSDHISSARCGIMGATMRAMASSASRRAAPSPAADASIALANS